MTPESPLGPMPASARERIQFAAKKLEAVWLGHVLKEGTPSLGGGLGKSMASRLFKEMFDEAIAEKMAEKGTLGLSKQLIQQLLPEKTAASKEKTSQPGE